MKSLAKGEKLPDFTVFDTYGREVGRDMITAGRPSVLVLLPNLAAQDAADIVDNFRDDYNEFSVLRAAIVTIIRTDATSLNKFHSEHNLQFPVFADPKGGIFRKFGAMEGLLFRKPRKFAVVSDSSQTVTKAFRSVDSNKFSRQALYALRDQMGRSALMKKKQG